MQEKEMVLDILSGTKAGIGNYAKVITECSNQGLRTKFQQMRDSDEKFQYDLYKLAESKGYYHPAPAANPTDMQALQGSLQKDMGSGF